MWKLAFVFALTFFCFVAEIAFDDRDEPVRRGLVFLPRPAEFPADDGSDHLTGKGGFSHGEVALPHDLNLFYSAL
jgi:hypothetical protein